MTDVHQPPPGPTPPAEPKKNVFARIAGVLFAPAETFQDIAKRPDIVGPLLVIVILGYITTALVMPKFDYAAISAAQQEEMAKKNPNMSADQMAQMENITRAMTKVLAWAGPIFFIVWYVIVAGVLLLAFRLFGGEGTFPQAFSVTLFAWMPMLVLGIISTIVILARGTFDPTTAATLVKSNPAFLVDMKEQPVLYSLLSAFDLFTIWMIALLSIGFATISRKSKAMGAAIVVSLWLAIVVVKVGFAAFAASRMQG